MEVMCSYLVSVRGTFTTLGFSELLTTRMVEDLFLVWVKFFH